MPDDNHGGDESDAGRIEVTYDLEDDDGNLTQPNQVNSYVVTVAKLLEKLQEIPTPPYDPAALKTQAESEAGAAESAVETVDSIEAVFDEYLGTCYRSVVTDSADVEATYSCLRDAEVSAFTAFTGTRRRYSVDSEVHPEPQKDHLIDVTVVYSASGQLYATAKVQPTPTTDTLWLVNGRVADLTMTEVVTAGMQAVRHHFQDWVRAVGDEQAVALFGTVLFGVDAGAWAEKTGRSVVDVQTARDNGVTALRQSAHPSDLLVDEQQSTAAHVYRHGFETAADEIAADISVLETVLELDDSDRAVLKTLLGMVYQNTRDDRASIRLLLERLTDASYNAPEWASLVSVYTDYGGMTPQEYDQTAREITGQLTALLSDDGETLADDVDLSQPISDLPDIADR